MPGIASNRYNTVKGGSCAEELILHKRERKMLWELDSLGAPTVVCDKETHGKVLGVVGEH